MRISEKLVLGFLVYAALGSMVFRLSGRQRLIVAVVNLLSGSVLILLSRFAKDKRTRLLATVRDWLPCLLILLAYRESGLFFTPDPSHRLDHLFVRWDRRLLESRWVLDLLAVGAPWIEYYFEFSYLLCYPLIPLGLGSLYIGCHLAALGGPDTDRAIDRFWTAVLLALLGCYVVYPLFPLTPPRILFHDVPGPPVRPLLRKLNFWLLGEYSVGACIFPSGHVAGVTATALALRSSLPRVSVPFLVAAVSVAVATVYGRYHYALDAGAGALVGLAAAMASRRIHRHSRTQRASADFLGHLQ